MTLSNPLASATICVEMQTISHTRYVGVGTAQCGARYRVGYRVGHWVGHWVGYMLRSRVYSHYLTLINSSVLKQITPTPTTL